MLSFLQIVDYAKKHLCDLVQVDVTKHDDAALACVPDVFVPIHDGMIKGEDIKYIFAKQSDGDKRGVYRVIALKEFVVVGGNLVKEGDIGGLVDVKTYLGHKDNSWIDDTSEVLSSLVTGESFISKESEVKNCLIKNSTIENSELRNVVRVENSHLKEVLAEGSCSINKSAIYDSILVDRVHIENSKIYGSRLTFCNVADSKLKDEKIMGDAATLNMEKVYDYQAIAPKITKSPRLNPIINLFKNKKIY